MILAVRTRCRCCVGRKPTKRAVCHQCLVQWAEDNGFQVLSGGGRDPWVFLAKHRVLAKVVQTDEPPDSPTEDGEFWWFPGSTQGCDGKPNKKIGFRMNEVMPTEGVKNMDHVIMALMWLDQVS